MRRAHPGGKFEIAAHPHGQVLQPIFSPEIRQQGEMRRGGLFGWRNAHQAVDFQVAFIAGKGEQGLKSSRRDTGLLRLLTGIDLDEQARTTPDPFHGRRKRTGEFRPVERLDDVEQRHGIAGLVGLQRADKVQLKIRIRRPPMRPATMRLLNAILPEDALTGGQGRLDPPVRLLLGHGHEVRRRVSRLGQSAQQTCTARRNFVFTRVMHRSTYEPELRTSRKLRSAARSAQRHLPAGLPPVLVLTDPLRSPSPEHLANTLPAGWGLVYRHFGAPDAAEMADKIAKIARFRGVRLLIGADPALARRVGADGVHWPERLAIHARRAARAFPLNTLSAHFPSAVLGPQPDWVSARLLSTAFASGSPSSGKPVGAIRFRLLCNKARRPIYALGGVTAETAGRIAGVAGLAGVSFLNVA